MSGVCAGCGKHGGEADLLQDGSIYSVKLVYDIANGLNYTPICHYNGIPENACIQLYKDKAKKQIADREAKLKADLIEDERKRKEQEEADKLATERYNRIMREQEYAKVYEDLIKPFERSPMALAKLKEILGIGEK